MSGSAQFFIKVVGAGFVLSLLVPLMMATEVGASGWWWVAAVACPALYGLAFWRWAAWLARREDERWARVEVP